MLKNAFTDKISNFFNNLNVLKLFELRFLYKVNLFLVALSFLVLADLVSTNYCLDVSDNWYLRERSQILFDRPFKRVRTLDFCGDRYINKIQKERLLLLEQLSKLHFSDFRKILKLKAQIRKFNTLLYPSKWYWRPKKNFITVYKMIDEIEDFSWVLNRTTPCDHPGNEHLGYYRYKFNLKESYFLNKNFEPFYAASQSERFLLETQRKQYAFSTENRFPYVKFDKLFETPTFVIYRSPPIKYLLKNEQVKIPHFKNNMFGNVQTVRHLLSQNKLTFLLVRFYDYFLKKIIDKIYLLLRIPNNASADQDMYHADVLRLSESNKFHSPFKYTYYLVNKKKLNRPTELFYTQKNRILYSETLGHKKAELNYDTAPIPYNLIISNPYHDLEVPFLEYKEFKTFRCTEKEYLRLKEFLFNRCLAYNQKITFLFVLIALLMTNSVLFMGLKISANFETAKFKRVLKKVYSLFNAWKQSANAIYLQKKIKKKTFST